MAGKEAQSLENRERLCWVSEETQVVGEKEAGYSSRWRQHVRCDRKFGNKQKHMLLDSGNVETVRVPQQKNSFSILVA